MFHMIRSIAPVIGLLSVAIADISIAAEVSVPVVGCRTSVQGEDEGPPDKIGPLPKLPEREASALSYYVSSYFTVLAPRGWHCAGLSGSSAFMLFVAADAADVNAPPSDGIKGPALQITKSFSGTSGRFDVAQISARLFPQNRKFVQSVIDEGMQPASNFPTEPYPGDKIVRRTSDIVEFTTPAGQEGMGTHSWLAKGDLPIHGTAILDMNDEGNIITAEIRLPVDQEKLAEAILKHVEDQFSSP